MVATIKQTLKYQEYRKSQYLNLMNASDYGRHRGSVLYGCVVKPVGTSTQVQITPGALYTSYGTKIFIDLSESNDLKVDILANCKIGGKSPLAADNNVKRPLCIVIYAETIQDAAVPANMDNASVLGTAALSFGASLTTYNRSTGQPALVIEPVEPVNQLEAQPGTEFPHIDNLDASQVNPPEAGGPVTIRRNQIPLGYLLIGAAEDGSIPTQLGDGTGAWSPGITFVQFRNPWEATADFLGYDPMLGRNDAAMAAGSTGVSALKQDYGTFQVAGTPSIPLMSPHYGTAMPSDPTVPGVNPWDTIWHQYRLPSFFRDGDPIVDALRRLDYVMRLWMDRTGDQTLVASIQDRVHSELGTMPELAKILWFFTGGDGTTGQLNRNQIAWGNADSTPSATSTNWPLKSGVVSHDIIADAASTRYGDSHSAAIAYLEQTIRHMLADLTGLSIPRDALRSAGAWDRSSAFLQFLADGPAIARPAGDHSGAANRPISVLATHHGYLSGETFYDAIGHLATRAAHGQSTNLLVNPHFAQGDNSSNTDGAPFAWNMPGGATWNRTVAAPGSTVVQAPFLTVVLPASDTVGMWQEISTADAALFSGLTLGATMSATLNAAVSSGGPLVLQVEGYNGATLVFSTKSVPQNGASWFTHSISWTVDAAVTTVTKFRISARTEGAGGTFLIGGLWLGLGSPNLAPALDRGEETFLTRVGGTQAGWRGHQVTGGYDVYFGTAYNTAVFNDRTVRATFGGGSRPTVGGAAVDPFISDASPAKSVLQALVARTSATASPNLLVNSSFRHSPAATGTQASMPTGWVSTGNLTWTHEGGDGRMSDTAYVLSANAGIQQVVTMLGSTLAGIDYVSGMPVISATAMLANTGAARLLVESLNASNTVIDSAYVDVPVSAAVRVVSVSATFPTAARKLRVTVLDTSGASNTVRLFGVTACAGMAHATSVDRSDELALSRYDAANNVMHTDISMGGTYRVRDLANPVLDGDAVNLWTLNNELSYIYGTPQNAMVRDYTGSAYSFAWPEIRGRKVRRLYFFLVGAAGGNSADWSDWPTTGVGAYGGYGGKCAAYIDYVPGQETVEIWVGQGGGNGWGQWGGFGMTGAGGGACTRLVYNGVSYYAGGGAGADGPGFRRSGVAGNGGADAVETSVGEGQGTAGVGPPDKTTLGGARSAGTGGSTEYNVAVANMLLSSVPSGRGTPTASGCINPGYGTAPRGNNGCAVLAW